MRNDPIADGEGAGAVERPSLADAPTIDGYTIERELGRGGEAIVYLAREHGLDRLVALKVLRPELAATLHAERFVQEIAFLARLTHPNILPLLRAGRSNGVLFYTSPYIEGESLRSRIRREKQLGIPEAVRIAREVASALDYACRHDVIHRDIKPENILLADGHAVVADFGIARAVDLATDHRLTPGGLGIGTLFYMSPEQINGDSHVGGRADIYALGCVLYEMLLGSTPFHGRSASNIIAHHLASPVPSIRDVRAEVPQALEDAIMKSLAKTPADRFRTADEFGDAVERAGGERTKPRDKVPRVLRLASRVRLAAAGVALVAAGAILLGARGLADAAWSWWGAKGNVPDSAWVRLAVLPVGGSDSLARPSVGRQMRDALSRWRDVAVKDELQVDEALRRRRIPLSLEDARDVATGLGVEKFVRIGADRVGDSLDVSAALYESSSGNRVAYAQSRIAASFVGAAPVFAALADTLLLPHQLPHRRAERTPGTALLRARSAYLAGHRAVVEWNLPLADSLFDEATQADEEYARALLWLAQVRSWRGRPVPLWASQAVRAHARRAELNAADTLAADALVAYAEGRVPEACALWRDATVAYPSDFATWYGYANCLRRDNAVIPNASGAAKWRFRSSHNTALDAYQRAFHLLPSVGAFKEIAHLLKTHSTQIRGGKALHPDTLQFYAYPSVDADSIAFIPVTVADFSAMRAPVRRDRINAATLRFRKLYGEIAVAWRTMSPNSSDALEAVAMSLDLHGDPAALDTIRVARNMAQAPDDSVRLAVLEAWMRVKMSLPADSAGLGRATALADSLLRANPPATAREPNLLAGLAALLGRAEMAATYARFDAARQEDGVKGPAWESAAQLRAFASLGGPTDRLRTLEAAINEAIASRRQSDDASAITEVVVRAATLVFPEDTMPSLVTADTTGDYLVAMLRALLRRDATGARRWLDHIDSRRRTLHPSDLTFDALQPEAAVLAALGDPAGAARWLDPTLDRISQVAVKTLADEEGARAGPLVRALVLRAELANDLGDRATARRYAAAVVVLWAQADPFLRPTVNRMKQLARQ